jgi:hypothetical protein
MPDFCTVRIQLCLSRQRRESRLADNLFCIVLFHVCDRDKYYLDCKHLKGEEIELLENTKAHDTQLT